jgi:uncharacterized repeat protein (TIGR04042 family)
MPEMYFTVRWPDGTKQRCYSPSLIIQELMIEGAAYPVYEFMERSRAGLRIGAERVRAKYGFYCSAAMDQLTHLETQAASFAPESQVQVLKFSSNPDVADSP